MRVKPVEMKPSEPEEEVAVLSVRLRSGNFESSVSIPLNASKEVKDKAVGQWLKMIAFALSNDVLELRASLSEVPPVSA